MAALQTLDVGNSSLGLVTWHGDDAELVRFVDPVDAAAAVHAPLRVLSVNGDRLAGFLAALPAARRAEVQLLDGVPVRLADERLAGSAGADRLAVAVALLPGPGVCVDAGTAVTVDLVDGTGTYLGGFIAPGPRAAMAGLAGAAPALPALPGGPVPIRPGVDTHGALSAGAWGLAVGGIDRLVAAAFEALGAEVPVVATGGWGPAWAADSGLPHVRVDPLFVHRGIRLWSVPAC